MAKAGAGILLFRRRAGELEVLLVHLGGPFWTKKDAGAWFVPKGEIEPGEDALQAAKREFAEETGLSVAPDARLLPLGEVRQRAGKTVTAFAFEGDCDPSAIRSNTFELEWPPRSGRRQQFPEVDRAEFFSLDEAARKIHPAQAPFLSRLQRELARPPRPR